MQQLLEYVGNHPYLVAAAVGVLALLIVSEMRTRIQDFAAIAPAEAIRFMNQGGLVIDVREPAQFEAGHIGEARNIVPAELAGSAEQLRKYKEKPVILCCDTGMQAGSAARELAKLGFSKVFNLRGGLGAWRQENLPLVKGKAGGADGKGAKGARAS
jgi:rhodanese-related sulfurtransferase